jgi:RNA polymerase sigma factor (sigma-70 family)
MLSDLTTGFIGRLRSRDPAAWFELWETFGPILRGQLGKWGGGRLGAETIQDLSQETLAALSDAIDRHDPDNGARFSTWLLAIARHTFCGELDRRMAQKRGSGVRPGELFDDAALAAGGSSPAAQYEQAVFHAKVEAALRLVERESDFVEFSVFRLRVLEGRSGREVGEALGLSEPTVTRRLQRVRERLRARLAEVITRYSFTDDEAQEAARNGLQTNPNKADDALFDEAVAEIYHRQQDGRAQSGPAAGGRSAMP